MNKHKHSDQVFQVVAPGASSVVLVGDLTRFPMRRDLRGIWTTNVTLAPGPHHYRFIVDGKWQDDPACGSHMLNPFGSEDMMREAA